MKRAIVAPKAAIDPASDKEDSSTSVDPKTKRGIMVNKNKRKSTSLAAGLALMHGFAAKNVGKNRLTVCKRNLFKAACFIADTIPRYDQRSGTECSARGRHPLKLVLARNAVCDQCSVLIAR